MKEYDEALKNLNIALKIMNDIYGEEHLHAASVYVNLGLLYKQLDEYDKALYYFDKTFTIKKMYFNEDNIAISSMFNDIGDVYLRFEKYNEALEYFIKDVDILYKNYEDDTENRKYEKKFLVGNKNSSFFLKLMLKGRWLSILAMVIRLSIKLLMTIIMLPVKIIKNRSKIVSFINGFNSLKKKTKGEQKNIEGFGDDVYSMFSFMDKQTTFFNMHKNIKEKYIFIADLFYKNKDYKNSLQYYKRVMDFKRKIRMDDYTDIEENLLINFKIGKLYMLLNDINDAFEYCEKAFELYDYIFKMKMIRDKNKRKKKKNDEEQEDENTTDNGLNNTNIAELFNIFGQIYFIQNNYTKSLECFGKAIKIHELLPCEDIAEDIGNTEDDINFRSYNSMINIYCNIGKTYKEMGEFDKALMNYNKALESFLYDKYEDDSIQNKIVDEIIGLLDNDTEGKLSHLDTIMIYYGANIVCIKINKFNKELNANIAINNNKDDDLVKLYVFAGNLYMKLGEQNKAIEYYDKALLSYDNIIRNISEDDPDEKLKILKEKLVVEIKRHGNENIDVAKTYYSIGLVYKSLDEPDKRLEYYKKGLETRIKVQGEEHADTATQYNNVAVAYNFVGDSESALVYHNKAISIREKVLGEEHIDTASSYANIAFVYRDIDKHQEALVYFEKALKIYKNNSPRNYKRELEFYNEIILLQKNIFGEENEKTALSYYEMGSVHLKIKEYNKALENAKKALEIRKNIFGDENVATASSYFSVGAVYYRLKEYQKSLEYHNIGLELREKISKTQDYDISLSLTSIGLVYKELKIIDKALEYYNRALEINKKLFAEDDQRIKEVLKYIEAIGNSQNNP
jgi:tetratricopeptide (TPR) repeat protein